MTGAFRFLRSFTVFASAGLLFAFDSAMAGGYLNGKYWNSCENSVDSLGRFSYCSSGSDYLLKYSSGLYVYGNCNDNYYRHPSVSDPAAAAFHSKVCGASGAAPGGSNIYDVLKEIYRTNPCYGC